MVRSTSGPLRLLLALTCHIKLTETARFSNVFQSHMVLQRNAPIKVWGFGTANTAQASRACLGDDCADVTYTDGRSGRWTAELRARPADTAPLELTLFSGDTTQQILHDVVVGDVFLFSGQSNIDVGQSYGHQIYDPQLSGCQPLNDSNRLCSAINSTAQQASEQLAEQLGRKGLVRLMVVPTPSANGIRYNATPAAELAEVPDCPLCPIPTTPFVQCGCWGMKWRRANASNIRGFSATGWFTLEGLLALGNDAISGVPVGLVRSSVGGTQIQLWSSPEALKPCGPTMNPGFWQPYSALFSGMIMPLRGLSFSSLTWYQGEANVGPPDSWHGPQDYSCQIKNMLTDWRRKLSLPTLPVFVVELSAFCNEYDDHTFLTHCDQRTSHLTRANSHLPELRLAQGSSGQLDGVIMIANFDLGSLHPTLGSIHSSQKPALGERIARAMLKVVYKLDSIYEGPRVRSAVVNPNCTRWPNEPRTASGNVEASKGAYCVVVNFDVTGRESSLAFNRSAGCPVTSTGSPIILPFYCNMTHFGNSAGFEVLGASQGDLTPRWYPAQQVHIARGLPNSIVLIVGSGMGLVQRVRYAWADWPVVSVRNGPTGHSLPARGFDIAVEAASSA